MMIIRGDCFLLFTGTLRKRNTRRRGEREEKVVRKGKELVREQEPSPKVERASGNHVRRQVARDVNAVLLI
jgi:hypothetical protein